MVAAFTETRDKIRTVYESNEPYKSSGSGKTNDVSGADFQTIARFNPCNNVKSN